jgi:hypothetical protein
MQLFSGNFCTGYSCRENPDGTPLLGLGIDPAYSEMCSPASEDWLFSKEGLSKDDLNNKGVVVFTVK